MTFSYTLNDFLRDDQWQRTMRNRFLVPTYRKWSFEGRYVFTEKSHYSLLMQKRDAIDTLLQARVDLSVGVEEKIERWHGQPRQNFFLETQSCTVPGRESDGWMVYANCDVLFYLFAQEDARIMDGYLILQFPRLQKWFWDHYQDYKPKTLRHTLNKTRGYPVPILDAIRVAKTERYILSDSSYARVSLPTTLEEVMSIPNCAYSALKLECIKSEVPA